MDAKRNFDPELGLFLYRAIESSEYTYETLAEALGIIYSLLFHTPEIVYAQISVQSPQMGQNFKITDYAHTKTTVTYR